MKLILLALVFVAVLSEDIFIEYGSNDSLILSKYLHGIEN